ncbi:MAG: hypothetical protein ACK5JD_04675, partial [Mangrovibacterium sp.]
MKINVYLGILKHLKAAAFLVVFVLTTTVADAASGLFVKKSGPSNPAPGETVTYVIEYRNQGSYLQHNVVITDLLPASNFTYVSSSPQGVYNSTTGKITWSKTEIPSLATLNSGVGYIYVTGIVGTKITDSSHYPSGYYVPGGTATITNTASMISDEYTADGTAAATGTAISTLTQVCTATMSNASGLIKSATSSIYKYVVAITNTGNVWNKWNLTYTQAGQTMASITFERLDGTTITATDWVAPGATFTFVVKLVTAGGTSPNGADNTLNLTATPVACGSSVTKPFVTDICGGGPACEGYNLLTVYKIDKPDPVEAGETLTYQIVIYNSNYDSKGSALAPLTNVVLRETFPTLVTLGSVGSAITNGVVLSPQPTFNSSTKEWTFSSLPSGLTTIDVTVIVNDNVASGTILTNTVSLLNGGTTYATFREQTTVLSGPDVYVEKAASQTTGNPGDIITYTLNYGNNGNYNATTVVIVDNYDENYMTPVADQLSGGTAANGMITWNKGTIAPSGSGTITYQMKIRDDVTFPAGDTYITNIATISSSVTDRGNLDDNTDEAQVKVSRLPDLGISKTSNFNPAEVGNNLTYTITVTNTGDVAHASGTYTVADVLPSNVTWVSNSTGGSYTAATHTVSWTVSTSLAVGGTSTFTVTVNGIDCTDASLVNNASVYSNTYTDKDASNNTTSLTTTVVDKTPPTAICQAVTVELDANGAASITAAQVNNGSYDNCSAVSLSLSKTTFDCSNIGSSPATTTLTVTDASGNSSTCDAAITVLDKLAPVLVGTIPGGAMGNLCKSQATVAPTVATIAALYKDNCGTVIATLVTASSGVTGTDCSWTATYTYTVTDNHGNSAANAVVIYTGGDTEAPQLTGTLPGGAMGNICMDAATAAPAVADIAALYTDNC